MSENFYTRKQIYAIVWQEPISHVAKRFGLSDVGLRKICVKHNIPTPPLGYWAKLAHGKPVKQDLLPDTGPGVEEKIYIARRHPQLGTLGATEDEVNSVIIHMPSVRPNVLHERVIAIEKALKAEKAGHDGFIDCSGLKVRISPSSIPRVILLLDTFLKFLTESGHTTTEQKGGISILFDGEPFKLSIHETVDKKPHIPTKQELKAEADYEADSRRLPNLYPPGRFKHKKWDQFASGRLSMDIRDPTIYSWQNENLVGRWNDRGATKVEDCLGIAIGALRNAAALAKSRRAENEEKARVESEKQERQKKEEARRVRAKKRENYLLKNADQLARHKLLVELLKHMTPQISEDPKEKDHKLLNNLRETIESLEYSLTAEQWRKDSDELAFYSDED